MIYLKTPEEIETMRSSALLISQCLGEVARNIQPGVSTRKLDTCLLYTSPSPRD